MHENLIIRPVREDDLPFILSFAKQAGPGFNSLSDDSSMMREQIECSIASFSKKIPIEKCAYFFVLEDYEEKQVIGVSGIKSHIGDPWPFYKYKLSKVNQVSSFLGQGKEHEIIQIVSEHQGASELGALFLKPAYRSSGMGALLSRSRCLFIANFPDLFSELLIADLRGVSDKKGISPFWEGLGRHFFGMDYAQASYLKATKGAQFMVDLMPQHPIYLDLLPTSAKEVIGKTHEKTTPALQILKKENFQFLNYIDIFDGGPTIQTSRGELSTIKDSKMVLLAGVKPVLEKGTLMLISNIHLEFRAGLGKALFTEHGEIILEESFAKSLQIEVNDRVRIDGRK